MTYFRFEKVKIQLQDNFAEGNHSVFQFDIKSRILSLPHDIDLLFSSF